MKKQLSRILLIGLIGLSLANAVHAQDDDVEVGAVAVWRFLDGPGAIGVMRVAPSVMKQEKLAAIGLFAIRVEGRGAYEGVYNLRGDGRSVIGMFWPEGRLNDGPVAGYLDLDAAGAGSASFLDDGGEVEIAAR